jgi:hypothetical protein
MFCEHDTRGSKNALRGSRNRAKMFLGVSESKLETSNGTQDGPEEDNRDHSGTKRDLMMARVASNNSNICSKRAKTAQGGSNAGQREPLGEQHGVQDGPRCYRGHDVLGLPYGASGV